MYGTPDIGYSNVTWHVGICVNFHTNIRWETGSNRRLIMLKMDDLGRSKLYVLLTTILCSINFLLDAGCAASSKVIQGTEVGAMSGNVVEHETIREASLSGNDVSVIRTKTPGQNPSS